MPTVKETFDLMPSKFKASNAAGVNKTIQYEISGEGGGTWHAVIKGGFVHGAICDFQVQRVVTTRCCLHELEVQAPTKEVIQQAGRVGDGAAAFERADRRLQGRPRLGAVRACVVATIAKVRRQHDGGVERLAGASRSAGSDSEGSW